ncbi:hypothetical protein Pint_09557 [Pistacia integerrima]|uniref:Uncharacterized protein n=1 Tax=Pistacia integerrima TaxID=434235 RepID=A0ACC0XHM3_9ROSI|nr:hypothetical protein Pint_09557 [Pistacia integerrima]
MALFYSTSSGQVASLEGQVASLDWNWNNSVSMKIGRKKGDREYGCHSERKQGNWVGEGHNKDYSSLGKRVFDIYIQGKPVQRDFNIKEKAGGPNKIWIESFIANVEDNIREICLLWGGKGSLFYLNGPIISAISVPPKFRIRRLSTSNIVGIVVGAVLASVLLLCLLYALMWRIGWIGDRESYVTYVKLRGKSYSLKQGKDATRNFSPSNKIGKGRFGIIYKVAQLPDQIVAMKKLSFQSNVDQIGTEVYALKQLKHENLVELLDVYSKRDCINISPTLRPTDTNESKSGSDIVLTLTITLESTKTP